MGENEILITKKKVRKAGENLALSKATKQDYQVISLWRNIHIPIMSAMVNSIKQKTKKHKLNADILARRLKRLDSIEIKLKRFNNMKLDRMQDIAGIRIVFKTIEQVKKYENIMQQSYLKGSRRFKLLKTYDYIENIKDDGYRSIHQIFEYQDSTKRVLELQIRTKLQHFWATAVEILGMKVKSRLKQGEGDECYKEFFRLTSALFCMKENSPCNIEYQDYSSEELCKKISELDEKYHICKMLSGLAISSKDIETTQNKAHHYFVVNLDLLKNTLRIFGYKKSDLDQAQELYDFFEEKSRENKNIEVVLISLDEIKHLRKAYPNYFLDSKEFLAIIKKELKTINLSNNKQENSNF